VRSPMERTISRRGRGPQRPAHRRHQQSAGRHLQRSDSAAGRAGGHQRDHVQPRNSRRAVVELFNTSASLGFDLSGWQIPGLNYTFAPGASIAPNGFLVLAANGAAFASAYGATHPVFDTFGENVLETNGATLLVLEQSGGGVVAQVQFSSAPPWPAGANGQGASLQLIDPAQDNWREGNWAAAMPAPDATNLTQSSLPPFPPLWINEVEPDNINGITNRAGQHAPGWNFTIQARPTWL